METRLDHVARQVLEDFKRRLCALGGAHVLEIRVFGSRARGEANADSDLDVFVMLDTDDRILRAQISHLAWDVTGEHELPFSVSPLVMTRDHFDELRRRERKIALDILEEGILV